MPKPKIQPPVIVLPGILGTTLHDEYPLGGQDLWTAMLHKEYERLSLHPDDTRYEAKEPARVVAGQPFTMIYGDLIAALRHELSPKADLPTPVFAFAYDWRQDLERAARRLDEFIEEVIARTKLLRHYKGYERDARVDLVAHSMGGLVICEYLKRYGSKRCVRKVVTIATPFLGSIEAVVKLTTGMGNLSGTIPSEREREMARSTPSVYHLLPSYDDAVEAKVPGLLADLFQPGAWQPSIVASLQEYVRLNSVKAGDAKENAALASALLARLLSAAAAHRTRVRELSLAECGLGANDWLVVIGAGTKTRVQVDITRQKGQPRLEVDAQGWVDDFPESTKTGDSTVPLAGGMPPFIGPEKLVAVIPEDFGFFELRDRAGFGLVGFHAFLPNMNLVQRLTIKHLWPDYGGKVWGRRALRSLGAWEPPISKLEERKDRE